MQAPGTQSIFEMHAETRDKIHLDPKKTCTGSCKVVWGSLGSPLSLRQGAVQHHARTSEWFLPDVCKILARNLSKVMRCQKISPVSTKIFSQGHVSTRSYRNVLEDFHRIRISQKIFSQGPVQDHARISSRISVGSLRDFLSRIRTRSRKTPLQKVTALSTRSCHKVSTTRAKESDLTGSGMEKVVRWLREQAQNSHTALGSDLTPRKCGDGCKSDVKIRIRLKRERSDTHKVPRGLREWNFATAPQWKRFLIDAKCRGSRWLHEHMLDFHHKDCAHHQLRIEKQRCLTKVTWNY